MTSLSVGSIQKVEIDGITSEGAGVGRLPDGRAVFAQRAAPGDRVRVEVREVRARWARGRVLEILEAGPSRREPPCALYGRCGGCTLQHLRYGAQLEAKQRIVTDALQRIGKRTCLPALEVHAAPQEIGYRNRVTFSLRRGRNGSVVAGFHGIDEPGEIVDVDGRCLLPEPAVTSAWDSLRQSWGGAACRLPRGDSLRLTLRATASDDVVLVVEGGSGGWDGGGLVPDVESLRAVWHLRGDRLGEPELVAGEGRLEEMWHGEEIDLSPGAFLQPNRRAASFVQDAVVAEAGEVRGKQVLDAYCGFGLYGRRLAQAGAKALGIEVDPGAARMPRTEAVEGFSLLQGRVEDLIHRGLPSHLVVLNPPRSGAGKGVMEALAEAAPSRIVYVSCDPATLARDLGRLGEGFTISRVQIFDLFPQTSHVETVVTIDAKGGS